MTPIIDGTLHPKGFCKNHVPQHRLATVARVVQGAMNQPMDFLTLSLHALLGCFLPFSNPILDYCQGPIQGRPSP